jgi:four helix bundle protein
MEAGQKITSYRDLLVWQKSILMAKAVYKLTAQFPPDERFGLISQMRRAAVSVASNIAEGQARQGRREFIQFLSHAEGSLAELDTQLVLALELKCCSVAGATPLQASITELQKMTSALRRKLNALVGSKQDRIGA